MMRKSIVITFLTAILITSVTAAGEFTHAEQGTTGDIKIDQGELQEKGLLGQIGGLLAFSGVQNTYSPGEQINVEIEAETQEQYDTADAQKVVSIYKCADSTCETPPPIDSSSEDQCSSEEWWPDYDDCISQDLDTASFSVTQDIGTSWTWDVGFSGLEDEAQYILVGFIRTDSQGIVTDVSKEKFTVEDTSSDSDDSSDTVEEQDVREVDGDIPVKIENGEIIATPEFTNVGGDMNDKDIVEMQVRAEGTGLLSFTSSQQTCDPEHPENVHKEFQIDSGDTKEIRLSTDVDNVAKGADYDVWIITREDCGEGPAQPYGTGVIADTVRVEEDLQEATVRLGSPSIQVTKTDSEVKTELDLENVGDKAMPDSDIIEMQVVPKGSGLLSVATQTSPQQVCDTGHPENVHREFQLDAGQEADVSLSTSLDNIEPGQKYDVWIITREDCFEGPAQPFGTGIKAGTITYSDTSTGGGEEGSSIPIILIIAGSIMVIGGAAYRWA